MKITAIKTSNFLGARDVDVKLAKPICRQGDGACDAPEAFR